MAKRKVVRGGQKILGTLGSGIGDQVLTKDATTKEIGEISPIDSSTFMSSTLANGKIFIGNAFNIAIAQSITGSILISNIGVTSISPDVITNANIFSGAGITYSKLNLTSSIVNNDIATAANITRNKLAVGTANRIIVNNASGVMTDATAITALRILASDANGIPVATSVTTAQFGYYDPTSSIQTQLNNRLTFSSAITPATGDVITYSGGVWTRFATGSAGQYLTTTGSALSWTTAPAGLPTGGTTHQVLRKIDATNFNTEWDTLQLDDITNVTATAAQVNVLATGFYDATSSIQTQLGAKLNASLASGAIWYGSGASVPTQLSPATNGQVLTLVSGFPQWQTVTGTGTVTSVAVSGGTTGLTTTGGPITTTGTITLAGTLVAVNGGTGQTSYTVGDILYASTTTALSKRTIGSSGQVLTVSGGIPVWSTPSSGPTSGSGTTVVGTNVDLGGTLTADFNLIGGFAVNLGDTTPLTQFVVNVTDGVNFASIGHYGGGFGLTSNPTVHATTFQTGTFLIDTTTGGPIIEPSAAIQIVSDDKALLLSNIATEASIVTPVNGMLYYNTTSNSTRVYQGGVWVDIVGNPNFIDGNGIVVNGSGDGFDLGGTLDQDTVINGNNKLFYIGGAGSDPKAFFVRSKGGNIGEGITLIADGTATGYTMTGVYINTYPISTNVEKFGITINGGTNWFLRNYTNYNIISMDASTSGYLDFAGKGVKISSTPNGGTSDIQASTLLDLVSTTKALALTRVAIEGNITTPVNGMLYYNTTTNKFRIRENGVWNDIFTATGSWSLASGGALTGTNTLTGTKAVLFTNYETGIGSVVIAPTNSGNIYAPLVIAPTTTGITAVSLGTAGSGVLFGNTITSGAATSFYKHIYYGNTYANGGFNNTTFVGHHYNTGVTGGGTGTKHYAYLIETGTVGIHNNTPTALLHIGAGTATAGTAPVKLTTGIPLTTPENGAVEYHSSHLYFTIGSTRYQLDQQGGLSGLTAGRVPYANSSTTITDEAGFEYDATNNRLLAGKLRVGTTDYIVINDTTNTIETAGTSTNINLTIKAKGTSIITLDASETDVKTLRITQGDVLFQNLADVGYFEQVFDGSGMKMISFNESGPFSILTGQGTSTNITPKSINITGGNGYPTTGNGGGGDINITSGTKRVGGSGNHGIISLTSGSTNYTSLVIGDGQMIATANYSSSITSTLTLGSGGTTLAVSSTGNITLGLGTGYIVLPTALANDNALTQVLVRDNATGYIKYRTAASLGGGGGGYALIEDEGTPLTVRTTLNIVSVGLLASDVASKTQLSLNSTLEAFASYNNDNFLVQTGADTFISREFFGTSGKIVVTNGDGQAGDPTFTIGSDIVDKTITNTYTAGAVQIFTASGTTAGLRIAAVAGAPGGLTNGDLWNDSTALDVYARINGISTPLTRQIIEDVTGTTYSFVESDRNKIKRATHASGCAMTIPASLSLGWGCVVYRASGAGTTTIASAGTLEAAGTTLNVEKTAASIFHRGSDIHMLLGAVGSPTAISRSIISSSGSVTMLAVSATDYVYLVTALHTMTLPTAVSNTNMYTVKNNHSAAITVNTTSSQTIDGSTSISLLPGESRDFISNNSNWSLI